MSNANTKLGLTEHVEFVDLKDAMKRAKSYVEAYAPEMAADILEMKDKALLRRDSKIHQLVEKLSFAGASARMLAENMVADECMKYVAQFSQSDWENMW